MTQLPAGWAETTLGEVAEVILGQSPPGSAYNVEGAGLPFFQGKAEFGPLFPTAVKWTTAGAKRAREGDVLMSVRAPVGPTNLAPYDCVIGRGLAALRPSVATTTRFLLWTMRASADHLAAQATGSTFTAVSGTQVRGHRLFLPPLNEQRRIIEAIEEEFSRLDAAEASSSATKPRLVRLRQAVLDPLMHGWPRRPLESMLREPLRNGHSAKRSPDGSGTPILTLTAVTTGQFNGRNLKYARLDPEQVRDLWLEPGDIFVQRSNTPELVGTTRLYQGNPGFAIFPDLLIRVRVGLDALEPAFVEAVLRSQDARRYFRTAAKGIAGSMPKITQHVVGAFRVPVPPIEEQRRIVVEVERQLSLVESMEAAVGRALARSAQLRRVILERAFTGRLVPQDPADEPASALLGRIAPRARRLP